MHQRAEHRAPGDPVDAERTDQERRAEQDAHVEQDRRQCRQQEVVVAVQDSLEDAADAEDQRADQQDAHQRDRLRHFLCAEAGRDDVLDQPGREQKAEGAQRQRYDEDSVDHGAGQTPTRRALVAGQEAAEDGDESVGQRPAADEQHDLLWDAVSRHEGVPLVAHAEHAGDDERLRQADRLGRAESDHQDERIARHALGVGLGRRRRRVAHCVLYRSETSEKNNLALALFRRRAAPNEPDTPLREGNSAGSHSSGNASRAVDLDGVGANRLGLALNQSNN